MKRIQKGCYGYREYRRKMQSLELIIGAAMIIGQLLARNFTDNQAAKNILTVMAVLTVLPVGQCGLSIFSFIPLSDAEKRVLPVHFSI